MRTANKDWQKVRIAPVCTERTSKQENLHPPVLARFQGKTRYSFQTSRTLLTISVTTTQQHWPQDERANVYWRAVKDPK